MPRPTRELPVSEQFRRVLLTLLRAAKVLRENEDPGDSEVLRLARGMAHALSLGYISPPGPHDDDLPF